MDTCPCCSERSFADCCQPYIEGQKLAEGPEELMRSRYTAFSLGEVKYLRETWHPETCPEDLGDEEPSGWVGLEIIEVAVDDEEVEAEVEFVAKLIDGKRLETLHELSQFEKVDGKWLYHSGEFKNEDSPTRKISGSEKCPCGSGKAFKNCHSK
ncbi:YchJ family metal-binding protein [Oligoflexaceae bacterium]|nr:YchJ family metal-binding protein [Oligoflexaceae bacterium]